MRLFICEKPSQGRDLAGVLGATRRGDGFLTGSGVTVTWAVGHLLETAPPEAYGQQYGKPWSLSALPILPAPGGLWSKKRRRISSKSSSGCCDRLTMWLLPLMQIGRGGHCA
jgi:DNA topoisomerase-3